MSSRPVNSPWAPAAGWKVKASMPVTAHSRSSVCASTSRQPATVCRGCRGWTPVKPRREAVSSFTAGLYFMVQEPRG